MKRAAAAILCLGFAGCALVPSFRPAPIPHADQVRRITISWGHGYPDWDAEIVAPRSPTIEDRKQIARITEFITAHAYGWRDPWHTLPNTRYYVVLECAGNFEFAFWIMADSIAGHVEGRNAIKKLSRHEMRDLLKLLGIPPQ